MRATMLGLALVLVLSSAGVAQACGREPREEVAVGETRYAATYDCDNALASCIAACAAGLCGELDGTDLWTCGDSNGIWGCQRGDEVQDDTCHGQIEADTIIF